MSNDFYGKAFPYEAFVCRAYQCDRQMRNGADMCFMQNLLMAEVGDSAVSHLPSTEVQFSKVRIYIIKAIDKFLKKRLKADEKLKLQELKQQTENAYSTSQLLQIIDDGLDVTSRFI